LLYTTDKNSDMYPGIKRERVIEKEKKKKPYLGNSN
jgi:hypothetical protein